MGDTLPSTPPASLLSIPSELRLIIYEYIGTPSVYPEFEMGETRICGARPDSTTRTLAALIRSCKTLRDELDDQLYRDRQASIEIWSWPFRRRNKLHWRHLGDHLSYLSPLQHVELRFNIAPEDMKADVHRQLVNRLQQVMVVLSGSRRLKRFEFSLSVVPGGRLQELEESLDDLRSSEVSSLGVEEENPAVLMTRELDYAWKITRLLKQRIETSGDYLGTMQARGV